MSQKLHHGKFSKYFKDERKWRELGCDASRCDDERLWRSEFVSCSDYPGSTPGLHFKREPNTDPPPDRGGWSARGLKNSFRTRGHDKDPRRDFIDKGQLKAWRNGVLHNPTAMEHAPRDVYDDREARVAAALGALKRTEQALDKVSKTLAENRDVVLNLLFRDFQVLKEAAHTLKQDRRHLLQDVHTDFSSLRAHARKLLSERKVLLSELQEEICQFEVQAYEAQVTREDMLVELRENRLKLDKERLMRDPKLEEIRMHWDMLEQLLAGLLDDREMISQQVMRYWPGLNYVAQHVRDDRKILIEAVQPFLKMRSVEECCNHESQLFWDCEAILDVVTEDSINLEGMTKKIRQSRLVVNKVIMEDYRSLTVAEDIMRADRAMVSAIVENTMVNGKW